jgi:hypothetical protein
MRRWFDGFAAAQVNLMHQNIIVLHSPAIMTARAAQTESKTPAQFTWMIWFLVSLFNGLDSQSLMVEENMQISSTL